MQASSCVLAGVVRYGCGADIASNDGCGCPCIRPWYGSLECRSRSCWSQYGIDCSYAAVANTDFGSADFGSADFGSADFGSADFGSAPFGDFAPSSAEEAGACFFAHFVLTEFLMGWFIFTRNPLTLRAQRASAVDLSVSASTRITEEGASSGSSDGSPAVSKAVSSGQPGSLAAGAHRPRRRCSCVEKLRSHAVKEM